MTTLSPTTYKRPILSTIFTICGVPILVAGIVFSVFGFLNRNFAEAVQYLGLIGFGVFCLGIAQAIEFLARTAYATERLGLTMITVVNCITRIEKDLWSGTPIPVRIERSPVAVATPKASSGYYYSDGGKQEGPLGVGDMKDLRNSGIITDVTPVFRDGDSQWRTYQNFPELLIR